MCDNEEPLRSLVAASLEPGYAIVEARNGQEGLALARESSPDLIVLDMMMPGMSGLDVLRAVRSDPSLKAIPVVMLTARAQARDREAAVEAGADRFLTKPFSPRELADIVGEVLGERGA